MSQIKLRVIEKEFAICKITSTDEADFSGEFVFLSKTDEELSLVCALEYVPQEPVIVERGFVTLKILGKLDFGLIGVLSGITGVLAANGISVFAVSTYDTDYILIKRDNLEKAADVLSAAGYSVAGDSWEKPPRPKAETKSSPLFIAFTIIGALLIGAGIIMVFATNWWKIPIEAKLFIAFVPLLAAQAAVLFTLLRKSDSDAFREGAALFLTLAIFAALALIGQAFHSPRELDVYVSVCVLLSLPNVYLLSSKASGTVCATGAIWVGLAYSHTQNVWINMALLALVLPFFIYRVYNTKSRHELWYILLLLSAVLPYYICKAGDEAARFFEPETVELALACGAALILLDGCVWFFKKHELYTLTPPKLIGIGVITLILAIASFPDYNIYSGYGYGFGILIFSGLAYSFIKARTASRKLLGTDLFVTAALVLAAFRYHWLAANALLAAIGMFYIYVGSRRYTLRHINFGMAVGIFVIAARFFDSGLPLLARGIAFILLGVCFLSANYFVFMKRKAAGQGGGKV